MEYILTAEGLQKKYRHSKALNDFSIHIPKGAIYGFVGENGAGKTTFLRILCGLQAPTSGAFTLYGVKNTEKSITKMRQRMGAVVESPSIYLDMTVTSARKSTGLGLSIAKLLTERMGGTITALYREEVLEICVSFPLPEADAAKHPSPEARKLT